MQHSGGDSWVLSPRCEDQLLGAQYAPVFLSSCCHRRLWEVEGS